MGKNTLKMDLIWHSIKFISKSNIKKFFMERFQNLSDDPRKRWLVLCNQITGVFLSGKKLYKSWSLQNGINLYRIMYSQYDGIIVFLIEVTTWWHKIEKTESLKNGQIAKFKMLLTRFVWACSWTVLKSLSYHSHPIDPA
jgi:hypothetical protein